MSKKNEYNEFLKKEALKYGIKGEYIDAEGEYLILNKGKIKKLFFGGVVSDLSSASAYQLAKHKYYGYLFLKKYKYPVLPTRRAKKLDDLFDFFNQYKPLVIKPAREKQGKGVTVNIKTKKELNLAWKAATKYNKNVIGQKYFAADDYRVLVIGKKKVLAIKRIPAHVVGDGKLTIKELIKENNKKIIKKIRKKPIKINDVLKRYLKRKKCSLEIVPERGAWVQVVGTANLHTGGETEDFTDKLPIEVKKEAINIVQQINLPVVGIDYLANEDFSERYILELNPDPGVQMHHRPMKGKKQNPTYDILELYFHNI